MYPAVFNLQVEKANDMKKQAIVRFHIVNVLLSLFLLCLMAIFLLPLIVHPTANEIVEEAYGKANDWILHNETPGFVVEDYAVTVGSLWDRAYCRVVKVCDTEVKAEMEQHRIGNIVIRRFAESYIQSDSNSVKIAAMYAVISVFVVSIFSLMLRESFVQSMIQNKFSVFEWKKQWKTFNSFLNCVWSVLILVFLAIVVWIPELRESYLKTIVDRYFSV